MSQIPLSNIQELLERSVFHKVRIECVDKGYLPDINSYPNTAAGQIAWDAALAAIVLDKGFAIEVFGYSNAQDKSTKKIPRIAIISQGFLPGALGGDLTPYFHPAGNGTFNQLEMPPQTADYYFNVHLVANTVQQIRILQAILAIALPRRKYINTYEDSTTFFIQNIGFLSQDRAAEGIIEHVYSYEIPDMWETDPIVTATGIAPLAEITIESVTDGTPDDIVLQSDSNDILQFTFPTSISTLIDPVNYTVVITVPIGTILTNLIGTFALSTLLCKAYIGAVLQESGVTPNDFTNPITYTIEAANGDEQDWVVSVDIPSKPLKPTILK